jgi:hypothetical protein
MSKGTGRWARFLAGIASLAYVAGVVSSMTSSSFPGVFVCVLAGALVCSGLMLAWLTLWASRRDSRVGQFGIGSLLFLSVFVAMFFSAARWIITASSAQIGWSADRWEPFAFVTIGGLVVVAVLTPFVLGMTEAILWAVVWLIRQRQTDINPPLRRDKPGGGEGKE